MMRSATSSWVTCASGMASWRTGSVRAYETFLNLGQPYHQKEVTLQMSGSCAIQGGKFSLWPVRQWQVQSLFKMVYIEANATYQSTTTWLSLESETCHTLSKRGDSLGVWHGISNLGCWYYCMFWPCGLRLCVTRIVPVDYKVILYSFVDETLDLKFCIAV